VTTEVNGDPVAPIPSAGDQFTPTAGYEQRQFQLGFKLSF
jgi:hypothetical protein